MIKEGCNQSLKKMKRVVLAISLIFGLAAADKPGHSAPTSGPVYSYYAPYPTTAPPAAPVEITSEIPPPPPVPEAPAAPAAPYDAYYDSLYYPSQQTYSAESTYDQGGLYYYYYPNEIEDTTLPPTTTTTAAPEVKSNEEWYTLQKLFIIMVGLGLAFPSRLTLDTVRRKREIVDP